MNTRNHACNDNQVFNHDFIYPNQMEDFAAGWQKSRGSKSGIFVWEEDNESGFYNIKIKNKADRLSTICQQRNFCIPVAYEQVWEVGVLTRADRDLKLVVIVHFLSPSSSRILRVTLDFVAGPEEEYHLGLLYVPAGVNAAFLELGLQETGAVWIEEVIFRRVIPAEKYSVDARGRLNINRVNEVERILEPVRIIQPLEVNARLIREYRETAEDLTAEYQLKASKIQDFSKLNEYSFFIVNQGPQDIWVQIEISPDKVNWINDSAKKRLQAGAMEVMVCNRFLRYGRIKYHTEGQHPANLQIVFQGQG